MSSDEEHAREVRQAMKDIWEILKGKDAVISLNTLLNCTVIAYLKAGVQKEMFFQHLNQSWDSYAKQAKEDV